MRLLEELKDAELAQRLVDALRGHGIESDVRAEAGNARLWVHDELDLDRARSLVDGWLSGEEDASLQAAAEEGRRMRQQQLFQDVRERAQLERAQQAAENIRRPRPTPLTYALIALSVALFFLSEQVDPRAMASLLWIADPNTIEVTSVRVLGFEFLWLSVPWSEPWRLITPIFIHGGMLHILFNMMWLHSLGTVVERRHGTTMLLIFVLVCGAVSNLAQYEIGQHPAFGGMSGVVYGLLGFLWIRGRFDPRAGYAINQFTVNFMLVWLVLGFADILPGVRMANWCHLGGLVVGAAWGFLSARAGARA